ncbi:hypothetical protein GS4_11_01050 [Gordonia soli NBRC 108243]|uniref:Uncharacterized protein n=1 Tax=Gordonia soli NBRC 108243 TaxID=1223545 RepID=M0QK82_9ACTN|nr:hypothetical protein GS4_11_01050 [Gordonia soli NBRC 108243]
MGLTGADVRVLVDHPDLAARVDGLGADFVALGVDAHSGREPGALPRRPTVEATVAIAVLADVVSTTTLLSVSSPFADHPYNIARRAATLHAITGRRGGVVIGATERSRRGSFPARADHEALAVATPVEVLADTAVIIRKLWLSWPLESVVADRERLLFSNGVQILGVDHNGVFRVTGPLNVPVPRSDQPLLAAIAPVDDELPDASADVVDVVVHPRARWRTGGRPRSTFDGAQYAEVVVGGDDAATAAQVAEAVAVGYDAVLLRPDPTSTVGATDLIDSTVPTLVRAGTIRPVGPLRGADWSTRAADLLTDARPAFGPVPAPA